MPGKTIEEALAELTRKLMQKPGVVGTAIGRHSGRPCIRVFVAKKTPALLKDVPASADGYEVVVEETGEIRALSES